MPFDTKRISLEEAENLMATAPWIERYLVGVAYGIFSSPRVSPSYDILDQNTASHEMKQVVNNLNHELHRLGINEVLPGSDNMIVLIDNLRDVLKRHDRANFIDWLVGNENTSFWDKAEKRNVWSLDDEGLKAFCRSLVCEGGY